VAPATRLIARIGARLMKQRRVIVERNMRRLHGEALDGDDMARAVRATFDSYTRYWIESFRLPGTSVAEVERGMRAEGFEHLDAALDAGQGAILALPHVGGWEWAAFWLAECKGIRVTAVVEPVQPPELAEWFARLRRRFGIEVVPLGPGAGGECVRALRANHLLCLLSDRDIAGGGVSVDFFSERTTLPAGPATLALRTGAPLVPVAAPFAGAGHVAVIRPPLAVERRAGLRADVARVTQDLAGELEILIRATPEQWHLMQPNWPSDYEALERARGGRWGFWHAQRSP
jgi:KDO2-lipid IV(A) lauroyltransferase